MQGKVRNYLQNGDDDFDLEKWVGCSTDKIVAGYRKQLCRQWWDLTSAEGGKGRKISEFKARQGYTG